MNRFLMIEEELKTYHKGKVAGAQSYFSRAHKTVSTKTWGDYFKDCMDGLGLPVPTSLFTSATAVLATIKAIHDAIAVYGTGVTVAELVGAGLLADALRVAGALAASFYAGALAGCVATATAEYALN